MRCESGICQLNILVWSLIQHLILKYTVIFYSEEFDA